MIKPLPEVTLLGWRGLAPGLATSAQFAGWIKGDVPYDAPVTLPVFGKSIPPMIRRRCSLVTKIALDSFFEVAQVEPQLPQTVNVVFASRFGELDVLVSLFQQLYKNESLSPIGFSNSVHHTATGFLSIISKNKGIATTVSAGNQTFACGLLEVLKLSCQHPNRRTVLIVADGMVPPALGGEQSLGGHLELGSKQVSAEKPPYVPFPFGVSLLFAPSLTVQNSNTKQGIFLNTFNTISTLDAMAYLNTSDDTEMLFRYLKEVSK